VKGKRLRFATDSQLNYTDGSQPVIIEDGYENHTKGPITSEAQVNRAIPIEGDAALLAKAFVQQEEVSCSFSLIDGGLHTIKPMRITACSFSADHQSGNNTGSVTFSGGKPTIT
jgi:hypothetical protein